MSGPKSAEYVLTRERRRAREERERREAAARERAEEQRRHEQARLELLSAVRNQHRQLALEQVQLASGLAGLGSGTDVPLLAPLPDIDDVSSAGLAALQERLNGISRRHAEIHERLNQARVLATVDLSHIGEGETVASLLDRFLAASNARPASDVSQGKVEHRRAVLDRIVARLREVSIDDLPPALESLLQRAAHAEGAAQFDMLCMELRLHVQGHNQRVAQRQESMHTAQAWLGRIAALDTDGLFADLREQLTDVAAGRRLWDAGLQTDCRDAVDRLERMAQRSRDAVAAEILEKTLRDLGYEVDEIAETLFADGGTVHFQSSDWGQHYMRLKVWPGRAALHFNMVRSDQGATNSRQDLEIEQRWCSGFPALIDALAARGIEIKTVRSQAAGTYPVEVVPADVLPKKRSTGQVSSAQPALQAMKPGGAR